MSYACNCFHLRPRQGEDQSARAAVNKLGVVCVCVWYVFTFNMYVDLSLYVYIYIYMFNLNWLNLFRRPRQGGRAVGPRCARRGADAPRLPPVRAQIIVHK